MGSTAVANLWELVGTHLNSKARGLSPTDELACSAVPLMLFRRRRVLAIWSAQLLSVLGDRFYALAIMWLALERGGPVVMGAVAIAESIPFIVIGIFGARLLQRCAAFRTLAAIDVVRAALVLVMPLLWAVGGTAAMLATTALLGVMAAVFDPSLGALVPDLVDENERPALVAAMDLNGRIARIAGPALAGVLLLAIPVSALFIADAMTFTVSVVALLYLAVGDSASRAIPKPAEVPEPPTRGASARALLRERPELSAAFTVHAAGLFLTALPAIGLPLLLVQQIGAGPSAYGSVLTVTGCAALVGNLTAARIRWRTAFLPRFCLAWATAGGLMVATGAAQSLALILVFAAMSGFVTPFISIALGTRLAAYPQPTRLRLITVNHTVMRSAGTAGMAIIPVLIAPSPARGFILGGTALAAVAGTAWAITFATARAPRIRSVQAAETIPTTHTNSADQTTRATGSTR
ncbi:MFS transporter [Nocardia sp. CDC153]|uniref:MFS transporter n=1 Tax=Nocardia sp. CDC153 TaxID=3112167 RepID=UPI002DB6201D|nr:MFS transporter [Nocardia sp. CDC153]MEC3957051.1 MFS transporter [Nocardia sp. CDC153]